MLTYHGKVNKTQDCWAGVLYVIDKIRSAKSCQMHDFFSFGHRCSSGLAV
jgi:hypothetical protein